MAKKKTPAQFVREVRQEGRKVTWPSRQETLFGSAMVFVMVFVMSLFFLLVDTVISWGIQGIIG